MRLEWSQAALADLDRFSAFLHDRHPTLARVIAREILAKARVLEAHPALGRPLAQDSAYRQLVLRVANARHVFRYRLAGGRIAMLRVFHGREARDP